MGSGSPLVQSFTFVQTGHKTLPSDLCPPTAEKQKERTRTRGIEEGGPTDTASV